MAFAIEEENKYVHPMTVIDTDYENYLIMYKCIEHHREALEEDDLTDEFEYFRSMIEDKGKTRMYALAQETLAMHLESKEF